MRAERYDIFCRVVDNFGDAAISWRLARALALEHGAAVRLWIDDRAPLERLVPATAKSESVEGVTVRAWDRAHEAEAAGIVIEAFGCGLPPEYVSAMLRVPRKPVWIVLEYLSAEPWVAAHHGLPSPHPQYPLERFFFFPGFTSDTGGLLREADLLRRRDGFGERERRAFWQELGYAEPTADAVVVSVFGYPDAPLEEWLEAWRNGDRRVVAAICEGPLLDRAAAYMTGAHSASRGTLELRALPFLPQPRYDELLWSCDLNVVRGEDSFVRAQWAARPFVWHAYPQKDAIHHAKLEAFLNLYCEGLEPGTRSAIAGAMRSWNQTAGEPVSAASAWGELMRHRALLEQHARAWAERIGGVGELAANVANFCRDKLK